MMGIGQYKAGVKHEGQPSKKKSKKGGKRGIGEYC